MQMRASTLMGACDPSAGERRLRAWSLSATTASFERETPENKACVRTRTAHLMIFPRLVQVYRKKVQVGRWLSKSSGPSHLERALRFPELAFWPAVTSHAEQEDLRGHSAQKQTPIKYYHNITYLHENSSGRRDIYSWCLVDVQTTFQTADKMREMPAALSPNLSQALYWLFA